jgi:hypothetical protein
VFAEMGLEVSDPYFAHDLSVVMNGHIVKPGMSCRAYAPVKDRSCASSAPASGRSLARFPAGPL